MTSIAPLGDRLLGDALRVDLEGFDLASGARAAVIIALPVVVGTLAGSVFDGMVACLGALNVVVADQLGSYGPR